MTTPTPIQIHISPALTHFTTPLSTFISTHASYTNFVVGSFIFSPSHKKVLLLQRASTERGFPSKWEIPGGSTELSDPTILHSAARETFEETGLHLTKVVRQVGDEGVEFTTEQGQKRWLKLSFEIQVMEVEGIGEEEGAEGNIEIRLDPEEHQAYVWAGEEDIRMGKYDITTPEQRELMLKAFELNRGFKGRAGQLADRTAEEGQI